MKPRNGGRLATRCCRTSREHKTRCKCRRVRGHRTGYTVPAEGSAEIASCLRQGVGDARLSGHAGGIMPTVDGNEKGTRCDGADGAGSVRDDAKARSRREGSGGREPEPDRSAKKKEAGGRLSGWRDHRIGRQDGSEQGENGTRPRASQSKSRTLGAVSGEVVDLAAA